jgi:hypothetical protein
MSKRVLKPVIFSCKDCPGGAITTLVPTELIIDDIIAASLRPLRYLKPSELDPGRIDLVAQVINLRNVHEERD